MFSMIYITSNLFAILCSLNMCKSDFNCTENKTIQCKSPDIITGVYDVQNCSSTNLNRSSINRFCIGKANCSNNSTSRTIKYECSATSYIFHRNSSPLPSILKKFYFSPSENVESIPELLRRGTVFHCVLINKDVNTILIKITIPILNFLSERQSLNIYNDAIRYFFDKTSSSNSEYEIYLMNNEKLTILYLNNVSCDSPNCGNDGQLLLKFEWNSTASMTLSCDYVIPSTIPPSTTSIIGSLSTSLITSSTNPQVLHQSSTAAGDVFIKDMRLNEGEIAGIAIGSFILLISVVISVACIVKYLRKKKSTNENNRQEVSISEVKSVVMHSREYEYAECLPTTVQLEGSDVSGSFIFGKNAHPEESHTETVKPNKKPRLITDEIFSDNTGNHTYKNVSNVADPLKNISFVDSANNVTIEENDLYNNINPSNGLNIINANAEIDAGCSGQTFHYKDKSRLNVLPSNKELNPEEKNAFQIENISLYSQNNYHQDPSSIYDEIQINQ